MLKKLDLKEKGTLISKFLLIFVVIFSFFFQGCSGCPYSFSGASVPAHLKTIAIPFAKDNSGSGQPNISDVLTQRLIKVFLDDNSFRIVDRANADAVLECSISSLVDVPAVISAGEQVSTRRITVSVQVVYKDLVKKKTIYDKQFSNQGDYPATGSLVERNLAIAKAIELISDDILLDTVSGW